MFLEIGRTESTPPTEMDSPRWRYRLFGRHKRVHMVIVQFTIAECKPGRTSIDAGLNGIEGCNLLGVHGRTASRFGFSQFDSAVGV